VKSKFSLFIAVAMMFALVFAGCAGDETDVGGEVEPIDEVQAETPRGDDSVELSGEEELPESFQEKDTFEYRGITFTGKYEEHRLGEIFHVDRDCLYFGEGMQLFYRSFDAALAFIGADTERILGYFDNEDSPDYSHEQANILNRMKSIMLRHVYYDVTRNNGLFSIHYFANFYPPHDVDYEHDTGFFVSMDMYLDDDNNWKLYYIATT